MYQLKNLIEKIEKEIKKFNIEENIEVKISNEQNYQFQINNFVKYQKHPDIKKINNHISEIIEEDSSVDIFEITDSFFINLNLNINEFANIFKNIRKLIQTDKQKKIIIDYGGPNIGKPLHVGHLRSLNIGRSLYNIHKIAGNSVLSDIHMGDWGMPVAQIINFMKENKIDVEKITIDQLEDIYPKSSELYNSEKKFKNSSKKISRKLNQNDNKLKNDWKKIKSVSLSAIEDTLSKLNHHFDLLLGESDVNHLIPQMLEDLISNKKISLDNGAYVSNLETSPRILITKSDGSYLYLTTDLATVLNRIDKFDFDLCLYVVDKRQNLHFKQLFESIEYFNFPKRKYEHVFFGTVNDSKGNPFKTREGGTKKLIDLFDETAKYIEKINKELNKDTLKLLANTVLTYSDLITNRKTDYKFDLEKFTNISGKTGIYVQYALVRAKKLLLEFNLKINEEQFYLSELTDEDKKLLYGLMKFELIFQQSLKNNEPHHLADYLYEISSLFNSMYQSENITNNKNNKVGHNKILITKYFIDYSILTMDALGIDPANKM